MQASPLGGEAVPVGRSTEVGLRLGALPAIFFQTINESRVFFFADIVLDIVLPQLLFDTWILGILVVLHKTAFCCHVELNPTDFFSTFANRFLPL